MAPSTSPGFLDRLRESLEGQELDLPLLPDAATQVVAACFEEQVDVHAVARMVELDPSLAANVLRISNTALYGGREPVVTLTQAITRLGLRTLSDITLSVAMQSRLFTSPHRSNTLRALWKHSALSALWARSIARLRRRNVESAFLLGLLHDIGRPLVIENADRLALEDGLEFGDDELADWTEELHAQVGERLLEAWQLPQWAVQAARWHHEPESAPSCREEAATACLADLVAHWSEDGDPDHGELLCAHPVLSDLGVYADDLHELFEQRDQVLEGVEGLL